MQTITHHLNDATVLAVTGRLDAVTAPAFEQESADLSASKLVLDLSGLEYVSSAGLRVILALAKRLKAAGGSLSLCGLDGLVREVFEISGFDAFLPIFETREAALAEQA